MRQIHPLLRVALLACPAEFRAYCAAELSADLDRRRAEPLPLWRTCFNVVWTGLCLRGENLWRDTTFAVRVLAKTPLFLVIAAATISLAVAANLTAFSILKATLLDPLPYPHGGALAFVSGTFRGQDETNIDYPDARDFAQHTRTFSAISVETPAQAGLTGVGRPVELHGWYVGADYFSILGAQAELGRLLNASDVGRQRIVVSDTLWRSRFGADVSVLGRRAMLGGRNYTIVGVVRRGFLSPGPGFMTASDYWVPINPRAANWRGFYNFYAIGRLRHDISWSQAQADLSRIAAQLAREYPRFDAQRGILVRPLSEVLTAPTRMLVLLLYGAAILVLLIAAANITNLLLVRGAAREHDFAVRSALGAARRRIAAQLVVEMVLVAAVGLVVGVALSSLCLRGIGISLAMIGQAFGSDMMIPGWNQVGLSPPVMIYGVAVTFLFAIVTAIVPAYAFTGDMVRLLNGAARAVGHVRRARLRAGLAIAEVVLAFAVLCSAGLLLQSFMRLERTPVGFREANVYSVQLYDLPSSRRYTTMGAVDKFYTRAITAFQALPGVSDAAEALAAGLGSNDNTDYSLDRPVGDAMTTVQDRYVEFNSVSPQFFETLGIPLLQGRAFQPSDTSLSQPVAIVSRSFAVAHFGNVSDALNKHVSIGQSTTKEFPLRRIVGVVADVRHSLSDLPSPEVYVPFAQVTYPGVLVVRTNRNDPQLTSEIDNAVAQIDPLLPPPRVVSFGLLRSINDATTRMAATVFVTLGAVALMLALAGVYGVVAYGVQRRTQEFGIRMSLGARTSTIAFQVVREALLLGVFGVAIGTILAALVARNLVGFLYQTSPLDTATFIAAAVFLLAAIALAACIPAAYATRVEPAAALRST